MTVNGEPGLALVVGEQVFSIMFFCTDGRHILDAYAVLNPDKLQHVQIS